MRRTIPRVCWSQNEGYFDKCAICLSKIHRGEEYMSLGDVRFDPRTNPPAHTDCLASLSGPHKREAFQQWPTDHYRDGDPTYPEYRID